MITLFTHTDLDGVGCAVLATLYARKTGQELTINYQGYNTINRAVGQFLDQSRPGRRDEIWITDISTDGRISQRLDRLPCKVRMMDHHPMKPGAVLLPWMHIDTDETQCGTSIVYKDLLEPLFPDHAGLRSFVEDVCLWDTWRYDKEIISKSEIMDTLHELIGHEAFLDMAVDDLDRGGGFEIPYYLELAVQGSIRSRNQMFESKEREMIVTEFEGYATGVLFADEHASSLAEYVFQRHPELDIVAVIYLPSGVSLRTRRDDVDLTEICHARGGGGHQKASAFRFDSDTAEQVVELLMR